MTTTTTAQALQELVAQARKTVGAPVPNRYWYPLSDVSYGDEEIAQALDSMVRFQTTMGDKVRRFEEAFAAEQGGGESVMVNSGSSADLLLAYLLIDPIEPLLKPGDEVLIPAVTWPTQLWSMLMAGLNVRLVDVDPATLNTSAELLERAISPKTRAVFLVHLMGNPCEMDSIVSLCKTKKLHLLEDCCEALGARWRDHKVGTFGLGGAFSFFFSHHITTMEGGMVHLPHAQRGDAARMLRAHGWQRNVRNTIDYSSFGIDARYVFRSWGFNVRPTELQAGFGLEQWRRLPGFARRRSELAQRFFQFITTTSSLKTPRVNPLATPSWMTLPLMVEKDAPFTRAQLTAHLERSGVETRPMVAGNLARQPVARLFSQMAAADLPGADAVHERGFYVGLTPVVTDAQLERLMAIFSEFLNGFK